MYKFNYSKMNRVIDNVKINLSNLTEIEDMINVFGGALLFFDDALSKAENLDNNLTSISANKIAKRNFNKNAIITQNGIKNKSVILKNSLVDIKFQSKKGLKLKCKDMH